MLTSKTRMSRLPVVIILGCTGTGKSKLAIEIAKKYGGEIVSADSMQVYRGLNIVTNKVNEDEQSEVPHHMLNVADPLYQFTVVDFRNMALKIVENLLAASKLPVIVGGTNYYIESLLWKMLIANIDEGESLPLTARNDSLQSKSNEELHEELKKVDPEMANSLHPNCRRKIIRSLEIYAQTGKTHSTLLREQREQEGGSDLSGPLRYPNSCILWLQCDLEVLDKRLDERVDHMLQQGLIKELMAFHEKYNKERLHCNELPDYTKGIFQTIGFKEFHNYLVLPDDEKESEKGQELFATGVFNLKLATRRYARTQIKWVRSRFLRSGRAPNVYGLDATDLSCWNDICDQAFSIVEAQMNGETPKTARPLPTQSSNYCPLTYYCKDCKRVFVGSKQFNDHLKSQKHKRILKSILKQKLNAEKIDAY